MVATEAALLAPLTPLARIERVAMVTVHTSPLSTLGGTDAGGLTVYVLALAEELAQRGVDVDIFTRRFDDITPEIVELSPGVRVITIEAGPAEPVDKNDLFCFLPDFASEVALFSLRAGLRYDVVHTHYWLSGWVGHLLKRYWNAPVVHMFHTLGHLKNAVSSAELAESALRLRIEHELLQLLDFTIAPNPDERAELIWGLGAKDSKICMIPPGINLDRFHPGDPIEARRELELPDQPLVLYVGRIDPIKNIETLLQSMSLLCGAPADANTPKLVIIGGQVIDGPGGKVLDADLQAVAARAAELGIREQLIFQGAQPQSVLPKYYAAATVCAVPSLYESFGLVAVEAMACGLPVVASRVGGMKFTVEEGVSGLLVPSGDAQAMANAIGRIIGDRDLRATFQIGARQAAIRFSWHTVSSAMLRLYENLAEGVDEDPCCYGEIYAS